LRLLGTANASTQYPVGIDLQAWRGIAGVTSTLRTQNGDIQIVGRSTGATSSGVGLSMLAQDDTRRMVIAATGTGSVTIDGKAVGTSPTDLSMSFVDVLSASGAIHLTGENTGLLFGTWPSGSTNFIGSKTGGLVTSSSANIYFVGNKLDFNAPVTVKTTGSVYVESFGDAFSTAVSLPSTFTVDSAATSFTLGKTTNTANLTVGTALSINGPIRLYGGNLTLNAALTTANTSTGDVLLRGADVNGAYGINLAAGRTLTVDNTGTSSILSGVVSGTSANLVKQGAGALYLRGVNSYTGLTTASAGYLELNTAGTVLTDVVNNAGFGFNLTADTTFAKAISGTGYVIKYGSNTLTLTAANTYTGVSYLYGGTLSVASLANGGVASNIGQSSSDAANLVINGGTLKYTGAGVSTDRLFTLGDSGATVDASGTGALVFTNTGALTYSGTAGRLLTLTGTNTNDNTMTPVLANNAGVSSFTKAGTGKWVMKAANTYTGVTTVSGGTLSVGDGTDALAALGSNTVSIATGTTLNFNHSADVTVANAISGAGQLNKLDTYILTLTGVNSYTGATGTGSAGGVVFTNNTAPSTSGFTGSGAVTIEPSTNSFGSLVTGNYTYANTLTGLTLGKVGNLTNVTLNSLVDIAGPITVYAPQITVNQALSSGAGLVLHGASVLNGGSINTTGAQTYDGAVTLGAATVLASSVSGDITLGGTLNGAYTLVVNTSGATTFTGIVGGTTPLTSVTTDAGGTVAINGGGVNTTGAQIYNEVATLGAATTLSSTSSGAITFGSTLNGAQTLAVNTSGATTFTGAVGGTASLTSLTTDAGGTVAINGGVVNTTGAQIYNDAATLGAATTLTSTGSGAITFGNTLNGAQTLVVNTSGATTFTAAVGNSTALTSLTTDAGGTVAINAGVVNTTGAQIYNEVATLGAATTLTSSGSGAITFGNTLNGAQTLAVNTSGATTFTAAVGNSTALTSLTTDAGGTLAINGGVVNTTGAQTYNDAATLGAATTFTSTGSGAITFGSTLNGGYTLAVNTAGATTFTGAVGGTAALTSLTTDAGGTVAINGGVVKTTGAQSYGEAATLGANTTLTSTAAGNITFGDTLDGTYTLAVNTAGITAFNGEVGGTTALTSITTDAPGSVSMGGGRIKTTGAQTYNDAIHLAAATTLQGVNLALLSTVDGTQALTLSDSGTTVLGGVIGGTSPLLSLTTDSLTTAAGETQLKGSSIHTTGSAVFNDIVKVFTDVTVQTGGDLKFMQTVNGDTVNTRSLTLDAGALGNISVQGVVGGTAALKTLEVLNSNTATFTGAVTTGTSVVLTDTVDAHAIAFNGGLTTPTLTVAAEPFAVTLRGAVSVTNATTFANTGALQLGGIESDDMHFAGGLTATAPSAITLAGVLHSDDAAIALGNANSTISLAEMTDINSGAGSLHVASPVSASEYRLRLLSTGPTTLDGDISSSGAMTFIGPLTFTHANILSAASFDFGSSVSFGGSSTITAGTTTFGGAVIAAGDLTVNGATVVNGGTVDAGSHKQTYNGSVTVGGLSTSTTTFTGVGMTFGGTLDGTSRVMVADSGATTYTGAIGATTAPAHFETDAAGSSTFSGGTVRTSSPNSIYIADAAVLMTNTTFDTTNNGALAAGANITFAKTLNGTANNAQAVTINAGTNGVVLFSGAVGNTVPLSTLTLTHSNGATFAAPVTVGTSVVLSNTVAGQTIRFADSLSTPVLTTTANGYNVELLGATTNVSAANTATTFLNTGNLVLGNAAGDTLTFAGGLTATAPAAVQAAGTLNTTNKALSLGDSDTALTLADHLTLDTTGGNASVGGNLTLGGAVNGTTANTQSLTLNAGSTGAVSVVGAMGQGTSLQTLTLTHSNGATFAAPVTVGTSVVLSNTVAGQTIRFADSLSTPVLTTAANGYNVELLGATTNVSAANTATSFLNTGNLVLGNAAGDTLTFAGGLTATAPTAVSAAGTLNTTNKALSLGDSNTALTLSDDLMLNTTGGNLTLGGAVNGTTANMQSLTLNAGSTGAVSVLGGVGQSVALKTLTLTNSFGAAFNSAVTTGTSVVLSNTVSGKTVSFANDLTTPVLTTTANAYNVELLGSATNINGTSAATTFLNTGSLVLGNADSDTLTFAGGLTATAPMAISSAGAIGTTNAAIVLGTAPVTLTGNTVFSAGSGAISLGGTVDGAYSLALNSTGVTTLSNTLGDSAALISVTTNAGGTLVMNGAVVKTTGAQSYGEAVTLGANTELTASGVTFDAVVSGAGGYSLTVNGTTTLNGSGVTTTGAQTYNGAITLGHDTTLDAGAADVTLGSTVDGTYALTVNTSGTTTFNGAVGGTTSLTSVTTNAGGLVLINTNTVHTSGAQTYNDLVSLLGDATLTGSSITFNDAVVSAGDLSLVGAAVLNAGTLTTTGAQSYSSTATLVRDTVLTAGSANTPKGVSFVGAVDSSTSGASALSVISSGATTFGSAVGGTYALRTLSTNAGGTVAINGGAVTTTSTQSYGEAMTLGRDTTLTGTGVMLGGAVSGAHALTVNGAATLNGGTVNTGTAAQHYSSTVSLGNTTTLTASGVTLDGAVSGNYSFSVNGTTTLNGGSVNTGTAAQSYSGAMTLGHDTTLTASDVSFGGAVSGAYALTVDGTAAINGSSVNTGSAAQHYMGAVSLGADTVLTASGVTLDNAVTGVHNLTVNGAVTLNGGTVNTGTAAQRYSSTVTLGHDTELTASGVTFDGAVSGAVSGAYALTVNGATTLNNGNVTTTGAQTYNGAMTLGHDTTLAASTANVTLGSTVNGAYALAVNTSGTTRFDGAVGGTTPLTTLTTNTGGMLVINTATVRTSGAQTYNDMVTLLGSTTFTGSTITYNDAVVGSADLSVVGAAVLNAGTLTTTGAQSYSSTVALMRDTSLTANSVSMAGAVSGAYAFTVNGAATLNGGSVNTGTAAQRYNSTVNFGGDTTLTASGLTFGDTVTSSGSLTVNGPVTMNGGSVTTAGAQNYSNAITLGANTTLTSTGGTLSFVSITDGAASFNLNVNSATALVLNDVTLHGNLHTTTQAGGVSQAASTHLDIGGTSTFTAAQTTQQNATINSAANRLVGTVKFDETAPGSWADVAVKTTTALTLAPLQSGGAVTLNTQGAALTTSSISATGNLNVNTAGGAASLGAATVSGAMTVLTANGAVTQTGQFVVTGNTSVTAGTGTITMLNPLNSFGGTLALQGTSTSVATSGNLQLASVTNTGPMVLRAPSGSINLGTAFITGGDLTLESQGNMNLGGANITGDLNMTSTQGTVSFGQATVTGSLTAATNGRQVDLGSANVGGNLNVQTNGGNVVQQAPSNGTPNAAMRVTGTTYINAGTGNVTLPNVPNQFGGVISLQATDVQLVASSNLIMGPSTIAGDASVASVTGNITQTAPMTVAGTSSFAATHGDVTLSQANTLTQAVTVQAVNANLNTNTALTLASSTVTGNLVATVAAGDITQTGPLLVTGTSNLAAAAGNITLTDAANNLGGRVSVDTPQALQLTTSGALSMGVVNVGMTTNLQSHGILDMGTESVYTGKLKVSSGGFDIIQSGPLKAGADEDFDAGSAKIDLFNPKNLWLGALYFKGGIIMINHPQLLNAVNSGVLMVRAETNMPIASVRTGGDVVAPAAQPATGSTGGNAVSVVVNRAPSTTQTGVIQVQVAADVAAPGKTFSFEMDPHAVAGHAADAPVKISQMDGKPLPNWLRYDAANKTFTANEVPAGAFPLQLKVAVGNTESVMVIQEKPPGK